MIDLIKDINILMELHEKEAPYLQFKACYLKVVEKYERKIKPGQLNKIMKAKGNTFPNESMIRSLNLSDVYQFLSKEEIKSNVYTPDSLANLLFENTPLKKGDRILDCSSGTGNLIMPFLKEYGEDIDIKINDIDKVATDIALIEAYANSGIATIKKSNQDFFAMTSKYDVIIGNPPYSGHKDMSFERKEMLKSDYGDVYSNKGDLYYAFFKKACSLLDNGGILSFIVSRYFLESDSAKGLRDFILKNFKIVFIYDFYGERPFGAGVDPCIIVLKKEEITEDYHFKAVREDIGSVKASSKNISKYSMKILSETEIKVISAIEDSATKSLGELGRFSQGIITGMDGVFIKTREEALKFGIESDLLVPWIKSRHLYDRHQGTMNDSFLVYPDKDTEKMNGFISYATKFETDLSKRREVKLGRRKFYELTWGRIKGDFIKKRILFPYKASDSRFILMGNVFHSADIYSYFLNDTEYYDYVITILNSPIYNTYIKTKLKKLGRNLFEYYPHRLKDVKIPDPLIWTDPNTFIEHISKMIQGCDKAENLI